MKSVVDMARGDEEEAMARSIDTRWNKIVDLSLKEEGVRAS